VVQLDMHGRTHSPPFRRADMHRLRGAGGAKGACTYAAIAKQLADTLLAQDHADFATTDIPLNDGHGSGW
jgi:hypothetical protein